MFWLIYLNLPENSMKNEENNAVSYWILAKKS